MPDAAPLPRLFGIQVVAGPTDYSVFDLTQSPSGNTVLRVGHTADSPDGPTWEQAEHVVLSSRHRRRLVAALLEQMDPTDRQELLDEVIDTESSNSRQHRIDTGAYLTHAESAAARA